MQIEKINECPFCNNDKFKTLGELHYGKKQAYSGLKIEGDFRSNLYKCKKCCSFFVSPRLSRDFSKNLYFDSPATRWINAEDVDEKDLDILFKKYAPAGFKNIFEKYFSKNKGGIILDVGCFQGKLLDIFKAYGYETYGVDLNSDAIQKITSRHNALCGEIEEAKKFNKKFDVITVFDLVEHLYDIDNFWKNISDLLKNDGTVVILTGNPESIGAKIFKNEWWYFKYPEHIIFPSKNYYKSIGIKYNLSIKDIFNVYHRAAYVRNITYKIKMYGLLLVSFMQNSVFNKPFSDFSISALSVPELSKDHYLIFMKKNNI